MIIIAIFILPKHIIFSYYLTANLYKNNYIKKWMQNFIVTVQ